jgi:hypothetical protein
MSSNHNSPLEHLIVVALAFSAGVVTTLAIQGYGMLMRYLSSND